MHFHYFDNNIDYMFVEWSLLSNNKAGRGECC